MSPVAMAGLLSVVVSFLDVKSSKYEFLMYFSDSIMREFYALGDVMRCLVIHRAIFELILDVCVDSESCWDCSYRQFPIAIESLRNF